MASTLSENLVEIAAEQLDPAKWATIQIIKGGRDPNMTAQQAADMIERVFGEALAMANALEVTRLRSKNCELLEALSRVARWCEVNNRKGSVLYKIATDAMKVGKSSTAVR